MVKDIVKSKGYLTLGSRLRRIGERLQAETQQIMAQHDVPIQAGQYPLLAALEENGALSVNALADALGVTQPGVTRSIGQLEKQGIVTLRRGEADQRTRIVSLTEQGHEIVRYGREEIWSQVEACLTDIMEGASGSLLQQLDHLEASLKQASFVQRTSAPSKEAVNG